MSKGPSRRVASSDVARMNVRRRRVGSPALFFMPRLSTEPCLTKPVWLTRGGQGDGRRATGDGQRATGDGRRATGDGRRDFVDLIGEWFGATKTSEAELAAGLDVVLDRAENLCRFCCSAGFRAKPQRGAG